MAKACGTSPGAWGRGGSTQVQVSTTPAWPTSTISVRGSLVTGAYSVGGTKTVPSLR